MPKRLSVVVAALAVLLITGTAAASAPAKKKPPVQLDGDVTNKGVGKVKSGEVDLETDDFYFDKTFVKGKAGTTVDVTITNEGSASHTFTIDAQDIDETLRPGDQVDVEVTIPANGKAVNFYCRFHLDSGMQGALFSTAGSGSGGKSESGGRRGSGGRYDSGDGGYGY